MDNQCFGGHVTKAEDQEAEALECLDHQDPADCVGPVEYRMPLSGTGESFSRCEGAWDKRLQEQERINQTYPAHPPSDWSPDDAGERWEADY